MSVFRIHQKKFDSNDSRKKFYCEESKPTLEISKNLSHILNQVQQKTKPNNNFKRRINTLPVKDSSIEISKINVSFSFTKKIYETYNISKGKIQSLRNSKSNKKSLSGTKIDAVLSINKNSELFKNKEKSKLSPQHKNKNKRSPKIASKLSEEFKNREKSRGKISNRLLQEVSSSKFYFPQSITKRETKTNRVMGRELSQRLDELYKEGLNYYKRKNIVRALDTFLECLKIQSSHSDCLYYIGSCYFNLKQTENSVQFLQRLKRICPKYNTNLYLFLAINYKNLQLEKESIKVLSQGISYFPDFQQGLFYLGKHQIYQGKMYMKQQDYTNAVTALQKSISLNQNNFLAKLTLADAYLQLNQQILAIKLYKIVLHQNNKIQLNQRTHLSTHLKLIQLLTFSQLYDDPWLNISFQYCQTHMPQSTELQFFKLLQFYETRRQITPTEIQSLKINLNSCFNDIENQRVRIQCVKLMLRILIDTKDLYKAEDTLKMMQKQTGNQTNLTKWRLFIEGANDIIKQKDSKGKEKLTLCLQRLDLENKFQTFNSNLIPNPYKDYLYLKHYTLEYLGYVEFNAQNLEGTLKVYEEILQNDTRSSHCQSLTESEKTSISRFRKKYDPNFKSLEINKIIVHSIKEHLLNQNYLNAKKGFSLALSQMQTPQRLFIWVINQVAIFKIQSLLKKNQQNTTLNETKSKWSQVLQKLKTAEQMSPNFSLIFFFHSLVLLYLKDNKQALQKVKKAIQRMDDPVSEYHYVEGLCFFLISEEDKNIESAYQGLESINKAIEIDSKIPQFFKERSKHYFSLERYQDALRDIIRVQLQNNDYEAKLLSMFYHYLCGNYHQSEKIMKQLLCDQKESLEQQYSGQGQCFVGTNSQNIKSDSAHYYQHFQQALMFRLNKYSKIGKISQLLLSLTSNINQREGNQQLDAKYLNELDEILQNRESYSEFTIYFINLLMSVYFLYQKDLQTCMFYLFSCLAQIQVEGQYGFNSKIKSMKIEKLKQNLSQCSNTTNKTIKNRTQSMLSQVKYNVIIASLLKSYEYHVADQKSSLKQQCIQQHKNIETSYKETLSFINSFTCESQSTELIETLQTIRELILSLQRTARPKQKNSTNLNQNNRISVSIKPYFQSEKLSDCFKDISLPIGDKYILVTFYLSPQITKPIVFYPQKLTFSIKPEFDNGFLFNFGLDKIENKLTPPWYKFAPNSIGKHSYQLIFTDQLRNQSIAITSTTKQSSIISKHKQSQPKYRYFNESLNKLQMQRKNFQYSIQKEEQVKFKHNIKYQINQLIIN